MPKRNPEFRLEIHARDNLLFFCPSSLVESKVFYPIKTGRFGSVVLDTKKHLFISQEAYNLLAKFARNRDAIGDFDWWDCDDGTSAISWFGPTIRSVKDPRGLQCARDTNVRLDRCNIIPNCPPKDATIEWIPNHENRLGTWTPPTPHEETPRHNRTRPVSPRKRQR